MQERTYSARGLRLPVLQAQLPKVLSSEVHASDLKSPYGFLGRLQKSAESHTDAAKK